MTEGHSREERVASLAEHLCARRPCGDTPENVADWLAYSLQECGLTLAVEPSPDVWQPSDDKCAICGKLRNQHSMAGGYPVCAIYPIFVSEREMAKRLSTPPQPESM